MATKTPKWEAHPTVDMRRSKSSKPTDTPSAIPTIAKPKSRRRPVKLPHTKLKRMFGLSLRLPIRGLFITLIIVGVLSPVIDQLLTNQRYALASTTESLLGQTNPGLVKKLAFDESNKRFRYNAEASSKASSSDGTAQVSVAGADKYAADLSQDSSQGIVLRDVQTDLSLSLIPQFKTMEGKLKNGRLIYPLETGDSQLVYSIKGDGLKEDITVPAEVGDKLSFSYQLQLPATLQAKLLANGGIGIYSADPALYGDISYGNDADRQKVELARQNGDKTHLAFVIPAPIIKQAGHSQLTTQNSQLAKAKFALKDNILTVSATGLTHASYPLSIDPTVIVTAAADFDLGNDESNVTFDDSNAQISRGQTTGGSVTGLTTTGTIGVARWAQGNTIYNNHLYVSGGSTGNCGLFCTSATLNTVDIATVNSNGTISAGTQSGSTFGTARKAHGSVAYNSYLYVVGGCTVVAAPCTSYTADIEVAPINNDGTLGSFVSQTNALPTSRAFLSVSAYNGFLYAIGGCNGSSCGTTLSEVRYAPLNADGSVGTWASANSLNVARKEHASTIYNGYLYVIGGSTSNNVQYAPIKADGSLGTWITSASTFTTARSREGGIAYKGYLYVQGGCSAFSGAQCTTFPSDLQYAPLNADGSIGDWSTISGLTNAARETAGLVGAFDHLYTVDGCTAEDNAGLLQPPIDCASGSTQTTATTGAIDVAGTVQTTSTTNSFSATSWGHGSTVNNGVIYSAGGCTNAGCTTLTGTVRRGAIAADGTVTWTNDTTNTLNGATGLAGFGLNVYNNTLYATGGWDGTNFSADDWYVALNADGTLSGAWTKQSGVLSGATKVAWHGSIAQNGYLYIFGGCNNTGAGPNCNTYSTTVQRATVNGGAPGSWSTTSLAALGTSRGFTTAAFSGKYIYVVGGYNGSNLNTVEYATLADDGTIASWSNTGVNLPSARRFSKATVVNGYLYVDGGFDTAVLNAEVFGKINQSTGDISSFTTNSPQVMNSARWGHSTVAYNGYIYNMGGCSAGTPASCTTAVSTVDYQRINGGGPGATTAWTSDTGYTTSRVGAGVAAYNGYIYIVGGCTSSTFCSTYSGNTQHAPLNPDGTIGTWVGTDPSLATARADLTLEVYNGFLYAIGGTNGSDLTSVEYSTIGASGVPGSWSTTSINALPAGRSDHASAVHNGFLYVIGGGSSGSTTTYYHAIAADGTLSGSWSTASTSFTTARSGLAAAIYNNNLYVIGGYDGSNYLQDVQFVPVSSTGDLGTWHYTTTLPRLTRYADIVTADGFVYIIGGASAAGTCYTTALAAPVGANGALGAWSQSINVFAGGGRQQGGTATYNGYIYDLGGGCGATITYATAAVHAGITAQPAISRYSGNIIDTGVDTEPARINTSGTLASADSAVNVLFSSARSSGAAFGTAYVNNAVILGSTPNALLAYDTSSVDQGRARYAWFTYVIDDSQTVAFPDSSSTESIISEYQYFYHPDPAHRLLHGKAFVNNTLQSLDATP